MAFPSHVKPGELETSAGAGAEGSNVTSSTSSVAGIGVSIGGSDVTLIHDESVGTMTDTETEGETSDEDDDDEGLRASTVTVKGQIEDPVADEEARRALREQLRRSMSQRRDTLHAEEHSQPVLGDSEKVEDVECVIEGVWSVPCF